MAITYIPIAFVDDAAYFDRPVTLLGSTYMFTMRYNTRSDGWTCDICDSNGALIVGGFALRAGRNLLDPYYANSAVPRGALVVADLTGKNSDPTRDSFGSTHKLMFAYDG